MATYTEIERKRLLAILGPNRELYCLTCAKVYTSGKEGDNWLDSDLEGFLCFYIDRVDKTRYFTLYEAETYDKLFNVELYTGFEKYYKVLSDNFHCLEMNHGFIGYKFENIFEASKFVENVQKISQDKALPLISKAKFDKGKEIINILKKKYGAILSKTKGILKDEYFGDDGMEICKPRHFALFNNFVYEYKIQQFVIGDIPSDLKKLFKILGLKKSDFKDTGYALYIFKILIQAFETLQKENKEKVTKLFKMDGKHLSSKEDKVEKSNSFLCFRKDLSTFSSKSQENLIKVSGSSQITNNVLKPSSIPIIPMTSVPKIPSLVLSIKIPVPVNIPTEKKEIDNKVIFINVSQNK